MLSIAKKKYGYLPWGDKVQLFMQKIFLQKVKINCGLKNKNVVYFFCRIIHFVPWTGG